MPTPAAVLAHLEKDEQGAIARLCDWLTIPSVSTDPEYADECRKAGQWLLDQLKSLGFEGALRETGGHPAVVARHPGPDGYAGPHILFYGHYDVQPADPLELWKSPPFEPQVVEGPRGKRIVARGAVDDKGQVMTFIEALRAWKEAGGGIPCRITVLVEGEEESGSVNLERFLKETREELVGSKSPTTPCDVVVVSDTGMWDIDTPAITSSLRGLCYMEVILRGPNRDLHSGLYGGCVPNPINELTRILGRLHDPETRKVTIPGFYDRVRDLTASERKEIKNLGFDEADFLGEIGLQEGVGEKGYTTLERQWVRPTCDINGIVGGYTGKGAKTVIASHASAKVSFRLVPDQNPADVARAFRTWVSAQVPPGCTVEFLEHGHGRPIRVPGDLPVMKSAREALREVSGKEPKLIGSGGSIPVVETFKTVLGLDTLLVGFGLDDDRVHSPNEKFEVGCFRLGCRAHAAMLGRFGEKG